MGPRTLSDYLARRRVDRARGLPPSSTGFFLVEVGVHRGAEEKPSLRPGYTTGEIDLDEVKARHLTIQQREVFALKKRPGGLFSSHISVGRTPNVDICLARQGVSKLHALFAEDELGVFTLTDRGSRNGTFIRGVRLEENVVTRVPNDCEVRFAHYNFRFMSAERFERLLSDLEDI